jgi:uncharacterized RDD family membrane protein YckC
MDERVSINTPDHIELDFEPAGLGSRLMAGMVDVLVIVGIFFALLIGGILAGLTAFSAGARGSGVVFLAVLIFLFYAVVWGYFVLCEALWHGQTPGKRLVGIRVVLDNGLPVGWRESALRNLVRAADMVPPPACLVGSLMILFSPRGKRLGDLLAGTMVVRASARGQVGNRMGCRGRTGKDKEGDHAGRHENRCPAATDRGTLSRPLRISRSEIPADSHVAYRVAVP